MKLTITILILAIVLIAGCSQEPRVYVGTCYAEYLEGNQVYVGLINSSEEAIEKTKENIDSFEIREFEIDEPPWNKTVAEYRTTGSYAHTKLKEGWYVAVYYTENICCLEFFISPEGYLMRFIRHPC
ncbi:MAG: hypothetical protein GTN40_03445 [Candidatus Aenigmarchaeota archaeon]|nr:hypothetical protein [Candidatus Aenigmarchaeota archaeon]